MTPQDDPEFWDRPADPPPAYESGDYLGLYEAFGVIYRGNLAIIQKTKTMYHYTADGWVAGPEPEDEDE